MDLKVWRRIDPLLLLVTLGLLGYGLAMNYTASLSVTAGSDILTWPVFRQGVYAAVGIGIMVILAFIDYGIYGNLALAGYVLSITALAVVVGLGEVAHGSKRWVDLGFTQIQPSEFAKVAVILALAKFFAMRQEETKKLTTLLLSICIVVLPLGLVYSQPDLGTALVLVSIWLGTVVVAGVRLIHLAVMGIGGVLSLRLIYDFLLHGYMRDRISTFLDPGSDPLGAGYNVLQSEISVGSGGVWGKGFTNGTQSQLRFLRVPTTDFIFSVLAEEMGFVGAGVLFVLFVIMLFRGLRAAELSRDPFGRLVAVGIVSMLLGHMFINVGVNVRLLPVTGIPLPFISYGGSSLLTMLSAIGLLQSIAIRRKKLET